MPGTYTQIEYIKSDGGGQYLDMGVKPHEIGGIYVTGSYDGNKTYVTLFGCAYTTDKSYYYLAQRGQNNSQISAYLLQSKGKDGITKSGFLNSVIHRRGFNNIDKTFVIDNSSVHTFTPQINELPYNIYVNAVNNNGTAGGFEPQTFTRIEIYNLSNILVKNLVPCYRNKDNKPGMYDIIGKRFYTNQGTGEFILPEKE